MQGCSCVEARENKGRQEEGGYEARPPLSEFSGSVPD